MRKLTLSAAMLGCALGFSVLASPAAASNFSVPSPYGNAPVSMLIGAIGNSTLEVVTQRLSDGACSIRKYAVAVNDIVTISASPGDDRIRVTGFQETPKLCGEMPARIDNLYFVHVAVLGGTGNDFMVGAADEFQGGSGADMIVNTSRDGSHYGGDGADLFIEYQWDGLAYDAFSGGNQDDIMCGMARNHRPLANGFGNAGNDTVGGNYDAARVEAEVKWPASNTYCNDQTSVAIWAMAVYWGG